MNQAPDATITITSLDQLDDAVGQRVTIVGVQTRTKIPTVLGVDIDGEYELSDARVTATGVLERYVVEPRPPDAPAIAWRGPGTFYRLVAPEGGLAKTAPAPAPAP